MRDRAGMLPVDKPAGPTSHDVVARARRALGIRRIGHTGTLDPFASGLLLLCVGSATRLVEYMAVLPKTYGATVRLGAATDTDDRTGHVIASTAVRPSMGRHEIEAVLGRYLGEIDQVPPAYSARKVAGERMYRRARQGESVAAEPARVLVHTIRLTRLDLPDFDLEITCSTGTYIRAIARDIGRDLGTYAHLAELRRTHIGTHDVDHAMSLDQLDDAAAVCAAWIEPVAALAHLPQLSVNADMASRLGHGMSVPAPVLAEGVPAGVMIAVCLEGRLVAVVESGNGWLRPRKVFV